MDVVTQFQTIIMSFLKLQQAKSPGSLVLAQAPAGHSSGITNQVTQNKHVLHHIYHDYVIL